MPYYEGHMHQSAYVAVQHIIFLIRSNKPFVQVIQWSTVYGFQSPVTGHQHHTIHSTLFIHSYT